VKQVKLIRKNVHIANTVLIKSLPGNLEMGDHEKKLRFFFFCVVSPRRLKSQNHSNKKTHANDDYTENELISIYFHV
jgi:hypothetical protein